MKVVNVVVTHKILLKDPTHVLWKQAQEVSEHTAWVTNVSLNSDAITLYKKLLHEAQQSQKDTENFHLNHRVDQNMKQD